MGQFFENKNMRIFLGLIFLIVFFSFGISEGYGHSMFNSAESFIGGFRVQIATLPEVPATGEVSQILLRVTDRDFNEVESFAMGIRIFFNNEQIDAVSPEFIEGGHWQTDYIFEKKGNHIFRVDLYDAAEDGGIITYTFNVSSQDPFGIIFIYSIASGSIGLAVILVYIYLPKKLKAKFRP